MKDADKNAWNELQAAMGDGEELESIVFGPWGWGRGYGEPDVPPVPKDKQGFALSPAEAQPLMQGWRIRGGFGAPACYALYAWTNKRVLWITQYDGATGLDSAPRNPCDIIPAMPGG